MRVRASLAVPGGLKATWPSEPPLAIKNTSTPTVRRNSSYPSGSLASGKRIFSSAILPPSGAPAFKTSKISNLAKRAQLKCFSNA